MSKPVDVNSDWLAACLVSWDLVSWAGKGPGYPGESCEGCLSSKIGKNIYVTDGNIMYLTDASRFLISCVIQHYAPVVGWGGWRNRCIMLIMTLDPSPLETNIKIASAGDRTQVAGVIGGHST
jgi:hypothetical protein